MKISSLKLALVAFSLCLGAFLLPSQVANAVDECSKELLLEYFPKQFVTETLKKFNVPQEKWDGIASALSSRDKDVVRLVEEKASKLNPNPLKDRDPQQRQVAVKLFRETLLQVFGEALQANGINDSRQVQSMLDDIQQQKARNFAQCMERQKAAQPGQSSEGAGELKREDAQERAPSDAEAQPMNAPQARQEGDDSTDQVADNEEGSAHDASEEVDHEGHEEESEKA